MKVCSYVGITLLLGVLSLTGLYILIDSLYEQSNIMLNTFTDIAAMDMSVEMQNQFDLLWK
ncbi:hypothetical protein NCCP2050_26030 [Planococcus sp. NCCP-2050]|nr:hypothetical protein NCCP2050_26030 [Planococcus sp. NCCP-2050]